MITVRPKPSQKPKLRGVSHLIASGAALIAGAALLSVARSPRALIAAGIYAAALFLMFAISALYHRPTWSQRARKVMRKVDHSAIFLLIAGTVTPIAVLKMGAAGERFMWTIWIGAGIGFLQALFWVEAPKIVTVLVYLGVGWLGAPYLPQLFQALGTERLVLIIVGGVLYSFGALIYGLRKPDPYPSVFGYHEIFHALVIAASGLHFAAIYGIVQGAA